MPSSNHPILFLAYANDLVDPDRNLRFLVPEIHAVRDLLNDRVAPPYRIEVRDHASLDDIIDVFDRYEGRVALFHYAGHANSFALMLSNGSIGNAPANLEGFARLLGTQPGLQLVFLNGCATQSHAEALVTAGVPSVVATEEAISDKAALVFAQRFYERLADGKWVDTAFEHAEIKTQTALMGRGSYRSLYLEDEITEEPSDFPWHLYGPGGKWKFRLQNRPKQGAIVPLLCDRDRQVEVFRDKLETVLQDDDHLPQFYVIHGEQMERHRSLVTRFREVDIRYHAERMYGPELGYVHFFDIKDWPNTGDLNLRKRNLLRSIAFGLNLPGIGGSQWDAQALLAALGLQTGVVVFQHTIQGEKWNSNSHKLIEWYTKDFWHLLPKQDMPQFLIFLNIIYTPETTSLIKRLFGGANRRQGIEKELYGMEEQLGKRFTVLRELKPIPKVDVDEWVEEHFADELAGLPEILFGDNPRRRLPMEVVERKLREEVDHLEREKARRELFEE